MKLILLAVLLASCAQLPPYACTTDDNCSGGQHPQVCHRSGPGAPSYCALADDACPKGKRWDLSAAAPLAGRCVEELSLELVGNYPIGRPAEAMSAGDLNGDGHLDLIVGNTVEKDLSVFLGRGDGSFALASVRPGTKEHPVAIAAGDLGGDGLADVVVGIVRYTNGAPRPEDSWLAYFRGLGDGSFAAPVELKAGTEPIALAIADLDQDGVTDLAVANSGSLDLSLLLGSGGGIFQAPLTLRLSNYGYPSALAIGDVTGDQLPDLVMGVGSAEGGSLGLFAAQVGGGFDQELRFPVGQGPRSLVLADWNGDGALDAAVANEKGGSVSVLLRANATFADAVDYAAGISPWRVAAGDLNADGKPDLVVADESTNAILVLLGLGDGSFDEPILVRTADTAFALVVGDFDHDGDDDVAAAAGTGELQVFLSMR